MDLEDETLADQFFDTANSNANSAAEEANSKSINANASAEIDSAPSTTRQASNLAHRAPLKRIQLAA